MKRASSAVKRYGGSSTLTGPRATARMRLKSHSSKAATAPMNTQAIGSGVSAAQPARISIRTLPYFSMSRSALLELGLLHQPFPLELRELLAHIGLVEEQRIKLVLAPLGIDSRIAEPGIDVRLSRVQLRHQLFQ